MPDLFKSLKITQPTPGGPLVEQVVGAVQVSTGTAADAGKLVVLNATGQIDSSMISGGGSTVHVNGTSVSNPNLNDTTPAAPGGHTNVQWQFDLSGNVSAYYITSGTTTPFTAITTGTNTTAVMTVGTGGTLTFSGTGVVNANQLDGISVTNTPAHEGQLLIVQPGLTTLAYADPLVQGLYAAGQQINAPVFATPTTIQPILIGGSDYSGTPLLQNWKVDSSGLGYVNVTGTVAATQSGTWNIGTVTTVTSITNPVTVTGTVAATQSGTWTVQQGSAPWSFIGNQSQNSTTGSTFTGYVGTLPAQANTAAPTWTDGKLVPLSVDTSGALRVSTSGTFVPALTADRTATGTITSTQNVVVSAAGGGTLVFNITGTWTGTIVFEASVDGVNWVTADAVPYQGAIPNGNIVSSATANGQWSLGIGGINSFRLRGNTVATGTATVWLEVGAGSNAILISDIVQGSISINNTVTVTGSVTVGGSVTANQGSAALVSGSWPVEVTDGTNILFTSTHPGDINLTQINGSAVSTAASGIIKIGVTDATGTNILSTNDSGTVGLNVHLTNTGGVSGTQYLEGTTVATPTGTVAMGKNPSNLIESLRLDASNNLNVNLNTALPTGTNTIGSVKITDGTHTAAVTTTSQLETQDSSDGLINTASQPPTALQIAGWDGSNLTPVSTTSNGFVNVNATVSGSFTPALTQDNVNTGTITAASQSVSLGGNGTQGAWSLIVNVTGTWSGTLQPQFQMPDNSWVAGSVYPTLPGGAAVSSITANGQWTIPVGGIHNFRLFSTAWTSGTATVNIEAGAGGYSVAVHQGTAANLAATVTQGPSGASPWLTNISQVSGSSVTLGQKTSANSFPVVVASDQSSINVVAQPGNNNIGNVGYTLPTAERLSFAAINFSSSGVNTVIAGVGGQTIRVFRLIFNVGGSTAISFSDGTTTFSGPLTFTTSGGMVLDLSGEPWYVTGLSNGFEFNSTGAVQVGGTIWYTQS